MPQKLWYRFKQIVVFIALAHIVAWNALGAVLMALWWLKSLGVVEIVGH